VKSFLIPAFATSDGGLIRRMRV